VAVELAPCSWPVQPCGPLPEEADPEYENLREAASFVVWALSGRQFGLCEVTVRPCRRECLEGPDAPWPLAYLDAGQWVNAGCRSCVGRCGCPAASEVRLPGPVYEVVSVTTDGVPVTGGPWRVDDSEWLVRTDGGSWPTCQPVGLPLTEEGTWGVTYVRGVPVPPAGQRAVGQLMSELHRACNREACNLPVRVQTIAARGGLPTTVLDPMDFFDKGRTGLYYVDLFLAAVNPKGRPQAARVLSPDMDEHRTQTWP
jgi:hypothetical protein